MEINLKSTTKVVTINGLPARIWEGQTKSGIPVHAFITRIAVDEDEDTTEFDKELQQHNAPSPEINLYPNRIIL